MTSGSDPSSPASSNPTDWSWRFPAIQACVSTESWDAARRLLEEASEIPQDAQTLTWITEILHHSDPHIAFQFVSSAIESHPQDSGLKAWHRLLAQETRAAQQTPSPEIQAPQPAASLPTSAPVANAAPITPVPLIPAPVPLTPPSGAAPNVLPELPSIPTPAASSPSVESASSVSAPIPAPTLSAPLTSAVIPSAPANEALPALPKLHGQSKKRGSKNTAASIALSVAVHLAILVLLNLLIIALPSQDPPEIVANVVSTSEVEAPIKKMAQATPTSATSSAAAPTAPQILTSQNAGAISLPVVNAPPVANAPINFGTGNMGVGFGKTGTGMGMGMGFGSIASRGTDLAGTLYDLKQTADGKPKKYDPNSDYERFISTLVDRNIRDSALRDVYKAKRQLYISHLLIPRMPADEAPKAFNVEKEVKPSGWFVHYTGEISAAEAGQYRFVGTVDDMMIILVDGKPVLDAGFSKKRYLNDRQMRDKPDSIGPGIGSDSLQPGHWFNLGAAFKRIDILMGERPGGIFFVGLMVQKKGVDYPTGKGGAPKLPLFLTAPLNPKDKEAIQTKINQRDGQINFDIDLDNVPVFKTRSPKAAAGF